MDWLIVDARWWPETVSPVEAAWVTSSILTAVVAFAAARRWGLVVRSLRRRTDGPARALAEMVAFACSAVALAAVLEVMGALPSLVTLPRPDTDANPTAFAAQVVTPISFVLLNLLLGVLALFLQQRTRSLGRRVVVDDPGEHGPRRRADDPPSHERRPEGRS